MVRVPPITADIAWMKISIGIANTAIKRPQVTMATFSETIADVVLVFFLLALTIK
ncbi:MAG TPA: hypothetical protein V6D26_26770 [Stenomitos sp.]